MQDCKQGVVTDHSDTNCIGLKQQQSAAALTWPLHFDCHLVTAKLRPEGALVNLAQACSCNRRAAEGDKHLLHWPLKGSSHHLHGSQTISVQHQLQPGSAAQGG